MKILIFSDIQFRYNDARSYYLPSGITSWLDCQLKIVRDIFEYANKNSIDTIVFNGDLFHEKYKISIPLYRVVFDTFSECLHNFNGILYMNVGNHDIYHKASFSSLFPFIEFENVIVCENARDYDGDVFFRIIPYGMVENDNIKPPETDKFKILFIHETVAGLTLGACDYVAGSEIKPYMLSDWDIVFNGHIHKPQVYKNIVCIGSPMQQDFGESGEQKGFIVFDSEKMDWERIPTEYPRFFVIDKLDDETRERISKDRYNYYRIKVSQESAKDTIFKYHNVFPEVIGKEKKTVRLDPSGSISDEIRRYIKIKNKDLDPDRLYEIGMGVVDEFDKIE